MGRLAPLGWLVVGGVLWAPALRAEVRVRSTTPCIDAHALSARLEEVVGAHASSAAASVDVRVDAEAAVDHAALHIEMTDARGGSVLSRALEIAPGDCGSAAQLVVTLVAAALRALPIEAVVEPVQPPPPVEPPPPPVPPLPDPPAAPPPPTVVSPAAAPVAAATAGAGPFLRVGLQAAVPPIAGVVEIVGGVRLGEGSHALLVAAVAALGTGGGLGGGTPLVLWTSLEVGWRFAAEDWRYGAGLRGGAVIVSGLGYNDGSVAAAPWVEACGRIAYNLGVADLGLALAVSPLTHRIATHGGASQPLSWLRVGPELTMEW